MKRLKEILWPPRMTVSEADWNHEHCNDMYELTMRVNRPTSRFCFWMIVIMCLAALPLQMIWWSPELQHLPTTVDIILLSVFGTAGGLAVTVALAYFIWEAITERRVEPLWLKEKKRQP